VELIQFGGVGPNSTDQGDFCRGALPYFCSLIWDSWFKFSSGSWTLFLGSDIPNPNWYADRPAARYGHTLVSSSDDYKAYLFAGHGLASDYYEDALGDLWEVDTLNETAIPLGPVDPESLDFQGSVDVFGEYNASNHPGGRFYHHAWYYEAADSMIIYGGDVGIGGQFIFNDVWEFSLSLGQWRLIAGTNDPWWCCFRDKPPPLDSPRNLYVDGLSPGGRSNAGFATGLADDSLLVFGGYSMGLDQHGHCNALWEFSLVNWEWRWLEGECDEYHGFGAIDSTFINSTFGPFGVFGSEWQPGSRWEPALVRMTNTTLLLFGGAEHTENLAFSDLWEYELPTHYCFEEIAGPDACNGTGTCVGDEVCVCPSGASQPTCEYWECFGLSGENETVVCSSHGECVAYNDCDCRPGYSGNECQIWACNGTLQNETAVCSSHGTCVESETCECTSGYEGTWCETWRCGSILHTSLDPLPCGFNGTCISPNNCSCDPGYSGPVCNQWFCYLVLNSDVPPEDPPLDPEDPLLSTFVCSGHGYCVSPDKCDCDATHAGELCHHTLIDLVEVFTCDGKLATEYPDVCNGHGWCIANDLCTCHSGYTGVGCDAPPSCSPSCGPNGVCVWLVDETSTCECDAGWDGLACDTNQVGRQELIDFLQALSDEVPRQATWDWDIYHEWRCRNPYYWPLCKVMNLLTVNDPVKGTRNCERKWKDNKRQFRCTWTATREVEWCPDRKSRECVPA